MGNAAFPKARPMEGQADTTGQRHPGGQDGLSRGLGRMHAENSPFLLFQVIHQIPVMLGPNS